MTPQERQMIDDLFDRLAQLESAPRDPEAARAIAQAGARAPNAIYALVQTTLLQDEALRRAHERIEALEAGQSQPQSGSFLDSMRDSLFGGAQARGSVPSVRPPETSRPVWNSGGTGYAPPPGVPYPQPGGYAPQSPAPQAGGGSSFLGTAAAAAAGMVGGSLLLGSIRNMMGGTQHGFGDQASLGNDHKTPWSGDNSNSGSGNGDLARDAGINDIGGHGGNSRAGLFDQGNTDSAYDTASHDAGDDGFDGDVGGDSDSA